MICLPPNTPHLFPCPLGQGCVCIYPVQKFPRAQYALYHWLIYNVLPNDSNLAILPEVKLFTKIALLQKILDTPVYYLINVPTLFRDNSHIKCSLMLKSRRKKKKKKKTHSTSLHFSNSPGPKQINFYLIHLSTNHLWLSGKENWTIFLIKLLRQMRFPLGDKSQQCLLYEKVPFF